MCSGCNPGVLCVPCFDSRSVRSQVKGGVRAGVCGKAVYCFRQPCHLPSPQVPLPALFSCSDVPQEIIWFKWKLPEDIKPRVIKLSNTRDTSFFFFAHVLFYTRLGTNCMFWGPKISFIQNKRTKFKRMHYFYLNCICNQHDMIFTNINLSNPYILPLSWADGSTGSWYFATQWALLMF